MDMGTHQTAKMDTRTHIKECQEIKEKANPTSKHSKAYYIKSTFNASIRLGSKSYAPFDHIFVHHCQRLVHLFMCTTFPGYKLFLSLLSGMHLSCNPAFPFYLPMQCYIHTYICMELMY